MKKNIALFLVLLSGVSIMTVLCKGVIKDYNLSASLSGILYDQEEINNKKLKFNIKTTTFKKFQSEKLTIDLPDNKKHDIKWKTSDKNVISLSNEKNNSVIVTARGTGNTAQVTATIDNSKTKSIRLTTRKKQEERYDMNMTGTGNQDTMYSWWTTPIFINDGNNDYYGFTTSQGYIGVAKYNKIDGTTTQNYLAQSYKKNDIEVDDHNAPAIIKLPDNKILTAFSSGHAKNDEMHIRISKKANDISEFGTDMVVKTNGNTTYSQILNKNNKYYIFHRCGGVNNWCYLSTSDPYNWSNNDKTFIKAPAQYYMKLVDTTMPDLVRFVLTFNPSAEASDAGNIRMGFIDFKTGYIYNAEYDGRVGSVMGTLDDTFSYDKFSVVVNKEQKRLTRLFDVAVTDPKDLELAYCTWEPQKNGHNYATYKVLRNKKVYTVANSVYGFWIKYFGGISFIKNNEFVTVTGEKNDSDKVSVYKFNNDKYVESSVLYKATNNEQFRTIRPVVSVNTSKNTNSDIMWLYGYYNHSHYDDFDMETMIYNSSIGTYKFDKTKIFTKQKESTKKKETTNKTNTSTNNNQSTTNTQGTQNNSVEKKSSNQNTQKPSSNNQTNQNKNTSPQKPSQNNQTNKNTNTQNNQTNQNNNNQSNQTNPNNNNQSNQTPKQTTPSTPVQPAPAPTPQISIKVEKQNRALTAGQCSNNHLTFDIVDTSGANITRVEFKNNTHDYQVFDASNISCSGNRCHVVIRKNQTDLYIRVTNSRNQNQILGKYKVCNIPMVVLNENTLKSGKCAKSATFTVEDRSGAQISSLQYSNTNGNWGLNTTVSYNASRTSATIIMKKSHNTIYFKAKNSYGIEQVFGPYKICIK